MTCQIMMSLGVYVLGAADAEERERVESHLRGCPPCRAELARLRPLPSLLVRVPDYMLAPARQPSAVGVAARVRRSAGERRWRAAAAVCAAAAAGVAGVWWLAPSGAGQPPATVMLSAANPATHVSATAALTATSWGTSIQLQMRGLPLNVECHLIVRSRTGAAEVGGFWDAWRAGPVTIPASAGWLPSDIASMQVATADETLVTMSRRPGPAGRAERQVAPSLGTAPQAGPGLAGVRGRGTRRETYAEGGGAIDEANAPGMTDVI
jgi:anti-sigma factor RsiW